MEPQRLYIAAFKDDVEGAKAQLESLETHEKASAINWMDEETGTSALWIAAWRGSLAMVELCISVGADVNLSRKKDKATPLFAASQCGHVACVKELLKKQETDTEQAMEGGYTPLLIATANGHLQVIQALLTRGASPNTPDVAGMSPLFVASYMGRSDIVKELIDHGASIDQQNKEGWTPLAAACHRQKMGVIQQLILSGSSVDAIPSGSWEKRLAKKVKKEVELQHSKDGDGQ
mmetsp:Transcript_10910/g.29940  ORF Transcript_10910/g.29940 Transcript_10910/m.29940 type:complete len:234 (-) Transcript_10910:637-1338(-)